MGLFLSTPWESVLVWNNLYLPLITFYSLIFGIYMQLWQAVFEVPKIMRSNLPTKISPISDCRIWKIFTGKHSQRNSTLFEWFTFWGQSVKFFSKPDWNWQQNGENGQIWINYFSKNTSTLDMLYLANIHYFTKVIVQTVLNFLSFQDMSEVPCSCFWLFHNCRHGKCPFSDFPRGITILNP